VKRVNLIGNDDGELNMRSLFTFHTFVLLPFILGCAIDDRDLRYLPKSDDVIEVLDNEQVNIPEPEMPEAIDVSDEFEIMVEKEEPEEKVFYRTLSQRIIRQLMSNIDLLSSREPMVVTTPVLASNFHEKVTLSHHLQQSFMSALHEYSFVLVDMNVADFIKVKPSGEFLLSRDWENVSGDIDVQMALVCTLVPDMKGMSINTRIVNVHSRRVIASSQVYVNVEEMTNFLRISHLITKNPSGVLEQNEKEGMQEIYILEDPSFKYKESQVDSDSDSDSDFESEFESE
tara:strand:- start:3701 stop:4561 length:861 start_codon:yes stop_codon:yes gene_type:complete